MSRDRDLPEGSGIFVGLMLAVPLWGLLAWSVAGCAARRPADPPVYDDECHQRQRDLLVVTRWQDQISEVKYHLCPGDELVDTGVGLEILHHHLVDKK